MAKILIDQERCKGCGFCIETCPKSLICFVESYNAMGYHPAQPLECEGDNVCTGCCLCAEMCPETAIIVFK